MQLKRIIAAVAALCVLAAPAAFAATAAPTPQPTTTTTTAPQAQAAAAQRQAKQHRAYRRNIRLAHRLAHMRGRHLGRDYARRARYSPLALLNRSNRRLIRKIAAEHRRNGAYDAAFRSVPRSTLRAIAACESHGNPRAIGGGGAYRGMFQMTFQIWHTVGGHGDPAAAAVREQYFRAALVYRRYGRGQWPVCGR